MIDSTLKNANILIVDDQEANIKVLTDLLEIKGYSNVKTTTDPRLVLDMFAEFKPDLILLDLAMPNLTGFQVMEQLKPLIPATSFLPILVLTADISEDAKRHSLADGAKDFLTKPFDLIEVDLRIRNLLETRYLHQLLENQNEILEDKVKERTIELENAYQQLEIANEELKNLDKVKTEFLQIISHEIRTPLNGILGFTNLLKSEIQAPDLQDHLNYLETSAIRLEKFSYQALMITELRTNRRKIHLERVPLNDLIDYVKSKLENEIKSKMINIVVQHDQSNPAIPGDMNLLQTCFENLVDNAIKYSSSNDEVIIRTFSNDQFTICEVIDNGPGFSTGALTNLYSLFGIGQIPADENKGLNLALTKLIMDAHEGQIEVHNNKFKGATVRLTFKNVPINN